MMCSHHGGCRAAVRVARTAPCPIASTPRDNTHSGEPHRQHPASGLLARRVGELSRGYTPARRHSIDLDGRHRDVRIGSRRQQSAAPAEVDRLIRAGTAHRAEINSAATALETVPAPVARYLRLALPRLEPIREVRFTHNALGQVWWRIPIGTVGRSLSRLSRTGRRVGAD